MIVLFGIQKKGRPGNAEEISPWNSCCSKLSRKSGWPMVAPSVAEAPWPQAGAIYNTP